MWSVSVCPRQRGPVRRNVRQWLQWHLSVSRPFVGRSVVCGREAGVWARRRHSAWQVVRGKGVAQAVAGGLHFPLPTPVPGA